MVSGVSALESKGSRDRLPFGAAAAGFAGFVSGVIELIAAASVPLGAAQPNADTPKPDSAPPRRRPQPPAPPSNRLAWCCRAELRPWSIGKWVKGGRWGQRVTGDTLPRRCGPTFPNYPQMFLMALADLKGK